VKTTQVRPPSYDNWKIRIIDLDCVLYVILYVQILADSWLNLIGQIKIVLFICKNDFTQIEEFLFFWQTIGIE